MEYDQTDELLEERQAVRSGPDVATPDRVNRMMRLATLLEGEFTATVARLGLNHKGDYDTLVALRKAEPDSTLSPTQLAEAAMITTGGMTSRLDRLEHAGYIERHTDPSDRRALLVHLTAGGRNLADEALAANIEWQQHLFAAISENDRATLDRIVRDLLIQLGDGR